MSGLGRAVGRILIDTSDLRRAQRDVQNASRVMSQSLGAIGVGIGAGQLARFAVEANELATSYRRQSVAARELAGSQGQLNELLNIYDQATGGALDKATQLANVTKLLSVGFADSSQELDQFARAIRGISVAMGRTQDFVAQNLILELFSQRGQRLDQLGLQYDKVRQRSEELQAADNSLTKEMAYQQAVLEQALERYGGLADSAEGSATALERLRTALSNVQLEFGQSGIVDSFAENAIKQLNDVRDTVQGLARDLQNLNRIQQGAQTPAPGFFTANPLGDFVDDLDQMLSDWLARTAGQLTQSQAAFVASAGARQAARRASFRPSTQVVDAGFTPEQRQIIRENADALADIERQAGEERLEATRQYEEQRTSTIRQYEVSIAREAEDFARNRLRAEQDFNRSVERIQRDAHRRDERAAQDLARSLVRFQEDSVERIADLQEDANKRLSELDTDFKKDQERREEDFQDDLLEAAGRLDAIRILELRKDRARQLKDAKDAHDDQRSDLKEQLDERINDEKEALEERRQEAIDAHDRQLEDAREADRQRQEDMQADFDLRQTREDEDRETRLRRMGEDFRLQLDELARQHALRIQQIIDQEARARAEQEEQFNKALNEAGIRNDAWIKENNRVTDAAVADYTRATQAAAANAAWLAQIAAGGGVNFPSLANPNLNLVRPIPGPSNNTPTGGWGREITINIYGDGLNEQQVVELMVHKLEEMAGGGGGRRFAP